MLSAEQNDLITRTNPGTKAGNLLRRYWQPAALVEEFDEAGIALGVGASILLFLYRSSRPHAAIVGQVPGTEHYRNVKRHKVETMPGVLSIRIDESLYFANARYLEDFVAAEAAKVPELTDVVLMCSAVNIIDMSALESLEAIQHRLSDMGVRLHLSEVKGPVMDKLAGTEFLDHLDGDVHLSQHQATLAIEKQKSRDADPGQTDRAGLVLS